MSVTRSHTVLFDDVGPVPVTVADRGSGPPFLLQHGRAGPASVSGFAERLAEAQSARVISPTHPGFDGTPRPTKLDRIAALAALYTGLLGSSPCRTSS